MAGKRVMELAGQYYVKEFEMEISIARIGNVYGPGMRLDEDKITVIPALIEKIFRSNNSIEVWGDGQQIRSFSYVQDVVEALLLLAEKCHLGEPTNISSGEGISIKTLITEILDITGANLEINFNESMPTGKPKKVESVSKRRERLGWQPKFTIREGLQKTIEWYREQQIFLR